MRNPALTTLVRERIDILFDLAEKNAVSHPERAKRYVQLARKLGTRYLVRLGKELKRRFCKHCNTFWVPGYNLRVRLLPRRRTEYRCGVCGRVTILPYGKK